MSDPRQDAAHVRRVIEARMEELRLSRSDLARATGLKEKTIYNVLSTDNGMQRKTKWALCDALGWTQDSIDRLYAGEEPQLADPDNTPNNVKRLPTPIDAIAERVAQVERTQTEGLEAMTAVFDRLDELSRQLRLLEVKVDRLGQTDTPNATGES